MTTAQFHQIIKDFDHFSKEDKESIIKASTDVPENVLDSFGTIIQDFNKTNKEILRKLRVKLERIFDKFHDDVTKNPELSEESKEVLINFANTFKEGLFREFK